MSVDRSPVAEILSLKEQKLLRKQSGKSAHHRAGNDQSFRRIGGHLRDILMLQDRSRKPACLLYKILRGKTVAGRKRGIDPLDFLP